MRFFILFLLSTACSTDKNTPYSTPIELPSPPSEPSIDAPEPQLRRLSTEQYKNAIIELLGEGLVIPSSLEPDTSVEGLISIGSAVTSISPIGAERYEAAAFALATQALIDDQLRANLLGCTPATTDDDECARQFITTFGRRAWRRPLTDDEIDRMVTLLQTIALDSNDFYTGVEFAIAGFLQSPHFLYRTEHGSEQNEQLTSFEMATRLSFLLWNNIPDRQLLDAAENGLLDTQQGLETQVQRMLDDPKIYTGIRNIFNEIFKLYELDHLTKDPLTFTHASPELGPAAKEETLRLLEYIVLDEREDFRNIFTSQKTFIDRRLAALYNIPAPTADGFGEAYFEREDNRRGLLGHASFLTLQAHATSSSPTLRGLFVRKNLLCQTIPPPPPDVDTSIPAVDAEAPTMRERINSHLADPSCSGCHNLTDLIGLGFENFDGIGRWRTHENDALIDASGELDGSHFNTAWDLAQAMADHPRLASCFSSHLLSYATGHPVEDGQDDYHQWLEESFVYHNWSFIELLRNLALSDGFRQRGEFE